MPVHLRLKRHVRFLERDGRVHALTTLDGGVDLPAGAAFDQMLAALEQEPPEADLPKDLALRMNGDAGVGTMLADRLFETGLIERFDPEVQQHARFDRQLLLFDALDMVKDHAESTARQQRLCDAHVLVLGLGGIGHQVALSLAAAGVGTITLVDGDTVEESNLHRQILFAHDEIGKLKVEAARRGILRIAPGCAVCVQQRMINSQKEWNELISGIPDARHIMISADKPVELVNWISDARVRYGYHLIKCGYMHTQGLIGPLLGPDTVGYEDLFESWAPMISAQPHAIKRFNAKAVAPTMAASNAIMANIAAMELIKHITGTGALTLLEKRMLLDLRDYSTTFG